MFLGPLWLAQTSRGRDASGRGCFCVIHISLLNYVHIYYTVKKGLRGTQLARIQCFESRSRWAGRGA